MSCWILLPSLDGRALCRGAWGRTGEWPSGGGVWTYPGCHSDVNWLGMVQPAEME